MGSLTAGDRVVYTQKSFDPRLEGEVGTVIKPYRNPDERTYWVIAWDNPVPFQGISAINIKNVTKVVETPTWEV